MSETTRNEYLNAPEKLAALLEELAAEVRRRPPESEQVRRSYDMLKSYTHDAKRMRLGKHHDRPGLVRG